MNVYQFDSIAVSYLSMPYILLNKSTGMHVKASYKICLIIIVNMSNDYEVEKSYHFKFI
jgi:hypothetical protein